LEIDMPLFPRLRDWLQRAPVRRWVGAHPWLSLGTLAGIGGGVAFVVWYF
jgi:hypothetical protein